MRFREERKRYVEGFVAGAILRVFIALLGWGSILLALEWATWLPICLFLIVTALVEGVFLIDHIRASPMGDKKN